MRTLLRVIAFSAAAASAIASTAALAQPAAGSTPKPLVERWLDGEVKAKYPPVTYDGAPITLRFSHFIPEFPLLVRAFKRLEQDTNGKLVVRPYWGNSLANAQRGAFEAVSGGVADFGACYSAMNPGGFRLAPALSTPFLFDNAARGTQAAMELYPEHLKKEYEAKNVYLWRISMTRPANLLAAKEPVETLEQLKGKKLMSTGSPLINDYIKALGGTPTPLQATEMYGGFQSGVVDAVPLHDAAFALFRLQEVGKFHTTVSLWPGAYESCINKPRFDSLPPDLKQIFYHWSQLTNHAEAVLYYDRAAEAARAAMKDKGIRMKVLEPQEEARWDSAVKVVSEAFAATNGPAGQALLKGLREKAARMKSLSDEDLTRQLLEKPVAGVVSF